MDKITHQIRAEHWTKVLNECINGGMSKTAWCRANGISEKQLFYWQRILRREAFENSKASLPTTAASHPSLVPTTQGTVSFTEIKLPSKSTVQEVLNLAKALSINWPVGEDTSNETLEALLYPGRAGIRQDAH